MAAWVMMAVKCMGKQCKKCPNLIIDVNTTRPEPGKEHEDNYLYCRDYWRCERHKQMTEGNHDNKSVF